CPSTPRISYPSSAGQAAGAEAPSAAVVGHNPYRRASNSGGVGGAPSPSAKAGGRGVLSEGINACSVAAQSAQRSTCSWRTRSSSSANRWSKNVCQRSRNGQPVMLPSFRWSGISLVQLPLKAFHLLIQHRHHPRRILAHVADAKAGPPGDLL